MKSLHKIIRGFAVCLCILATAGCVKEPPGPATTERLAIGDRHIATQPATGYVPPCKSHFEFGGVAASHLGTAILIEAGRHTGSASSISELSPVELFPGAFGGFTLATAGCPDGRNFVLIQRNPQSAPALTRGVSTEPCQIAGFDGCSPVVPGRASAVEAYLVVESAESDPALLAAELSRTGQDLNGQYLAELRHVSHGAWTPEGLVHRAVAPAQVGDNIGLGYVAKYLSAFAADWRRREPEAPSPRSLPDFMAKFGAGGELRNPLTNAVIPAVSLDRAEPGTYTDLSSEHGLLLLLHYQDAEGGVSSVLTGCTTVTPDHADPPRLFEVQEGKLVEIGQASS
ncbi:MAG: hypothetical protein GEEBNDBF_00176 [bacterium]|nr:hypothetical protein [bacterium]